MQICEKFSKLPPRPKNPSKLTLILSADDPEPNLIWIPVPKAPIPGSSTTFDNPLVETFLGEPRADAERFNVAKNEVRGYELDHTVILNARDNWLNDGTDMWGLAPPGWQLNVGSVLLVRKDQKDLSREQASALAEYLQFRVSAALENTPDSKSMTQKRAAI
ncbi:uncharacterized protein PAC_03652 [Phialocephala subalpina]|uniref:Uncharacterized protein n=1 Tax=Phialocephala subalpina TaxID=576137 RepID=A0A1L7WLX2_9HELO|nr:uncharacterized protein PAC_03652 [Phialocephala subalpina]